MTMQAIPGRVREFFTLTETERATRALPDEPRSLVWRELAIASQRREAAETLWPRGSAAEALKLLAASFEGISSAVSELASRVDPPHPPWLARAVAAVADARAKLGSFKSPELEAEVSPADEATFQQLVDALISIEEAIGPGAAPPSQLAALRRKRRAGGVIAAVVFVGFAAYALRTPPFSHAEASAVLGEHLAEHAIDGDTKTWWVLPPDTPGWLDLTLSKPRSVPALKIIGGNPPWNDHLTRDAHIEAFLRGALVKAVDVSFRIPPSGEPDWTEVKLDAPTCDRIRITPKSAWRGTGTIGEVTIP